MSLSVSGLLKPVNVRNDVSHNWQIMQIVYKFYNEQKFTDILFEFPYTKYKFTAHRLILAAASPYFLELFDNADDDCNSLTVTKMESDTFEQLVIYCYNGQTNITTGNAERMAKGAMLLRLYDVVDICVNYMMDHINDFIVRKLITLATEMEYKKFETRLLAYIVKNFEQLNQNGEIFDLNVAQWKFIIKELDVNVGAQADIFRAIKGWYEYKATERQQYLPDLIGSLALNEFDSDFLRQQIKPLPGCEALATEALTKRGELPSWVAVQTRGEDRFGYKDILLYNQAKEEWVKVISLEIEKFYFSTAFMENSLFFIGGIKTNGASATVLRYNLLTNKFSEIPSLKTDRFSSSVAVVNNSIYVIGGTNDSMDPLLSMECYSTSTGRWEYTSHLFMYRTLAGVAILNDDIYLIGGKDFHVVNSVERYNIVTKRWYYCEGMAEARENPGVVAHKGYIYAIGGCPKDLKTVERYDPKQDKWTKIASLNVARRHICAAAIGDQLWAFGGVIGPAQRDDTVEVYNVTSDKWLVKKKLPVTGEFDCVTLPTSLADNLK
ncbi:kelch-like protein 3 [Bactrocera oleae]|uniref:kelch-like protein 3 n=1 Tax=Bactrocera oleae TaxID=104688 RepID=UPI00387EAEDB